MLSGWRLRGGSGRGSEGVGRSLSLAREGGSVSHLCNADISEGRADLIRHRALIPDGLSQLLIAVC